MSSVPADSGQSRSARADAHRARGEAKRTHDSARSRRWGYWPLLPIATASAARSSLRHEGVGLDVTGPHQLAKRAQCVRLGDATTDARTPRHVGELLVAEPLLLLLLDYLGILGLRHRLHLVLSIRYTTREKPA